MQAFADQALISGTGKLAPQKGAVPVHLTVRNRGQKYEDAKKCHNFRDLIHDKKEWKI